MSTPCSSHHPRDVLLGAQAGAVVLPVCDHYSGVEARMRKSLALQAEMAAEFGACVFDVTLDCEDGAPVGGEAEHAALVTELALAAAPGMRVRRARAPGRPSGASPATWSPSPAAPAHRLSHLMVPKVESIDDVREAVRSARCRRRARRLPLHVLIESPLAVHHAFEIAAHPRVQSLSFGLMDFVSAHGGAIPAEGMGAAGQFTHPLVVRAKLDIASAAHAHGKVPSHCVVTEFNDIDAMRAAATRGGQRIRLHAHVEHPPEPDPPDPRGLRARRAADSNRYENHRSGRRRGRGRRSASMAHCMTARATAISGRCWSGRMPPGARLPPEAQAWFAAPSSP